MPSPFPATEEAQDSSAFKSIDLFQDSTLEIGVRTEARNLPHFVSRCRLDHTQSANTLTDERRSLSAQSRSLASSLRKRKPDMVTTGLLLLLLGFFLNIPLLWTLGVILLIVGVILMVLGSLGRAVGGRRHYW